jgi:hypothetical protein
MAYRYKATTEASWATDERQAQLRDAPVSSLAIEIIPETNTVEVSFLVAAANTRDAMTKGDDLMRRVSGGVSQAQGMATKEPE